MSVIVMLTRVTCAPFGSEDTLRFGVSRAGSIFTHTLLLQTLTGMVMPEAQSG